jgi:iron transport multicopper oxidase
MRPPYIAVTLIPIYLATSVLAGVKEIWWNITYVEGANPDGLFERRVVGVNNTWPYVISRLLMKTISHLYAVII